MHVIRILGYYNTDDLRKAAFFCGCVPIGCIPANSCFSFSTVKCNAS